MSDDVVALYRLPTLLIAECVLVYIEPNLSSQLINWAGKRFSTALFLNYEPVSTEHLLWLPCRATLVYLFSLSKTDKILGNKTVCCSM